MIKTADSIFVAGHRGLVGSAIVRELHSQGYDNLILKTHSEVDLVNQKACADFFQEYEPEYVFLAAAKVGGIMANWTYPASFIYENLMIEANVIHQAYLNGCKKLLFLGSSCIYPKFAKQPISEDQLLTGLLEETNEPYAIAKIAGIKLCQSYRREHGCDFISAMPTNLYGPGDNFDPQTSHALPALIRKFHEAKAQNAPSVTIWGTGTPRREFLHVDDLSNALVFLMDHYSSSDPINIGTGEDISITDLASMIAEIAGYDGAIQFDTSKPDGTPRKLLDISKLRDLGWHPRITLREGITTTFDWFNQNVHM